MPIIKKCKYKCCVIFIFCFSIILSGCNNNNKIFEHYKHAKFVKTEYNEVDRQINFNNLLSHGYSIKTIKDYSKNTKIDDMDTIKFGKYEQDGNLDNGKEDIEWIVLERQDDKLLILSKYI